MRRATLLLLLTTAPIPAQLPLSLPQMLARLGKEADAFRKIAPTLLSEETLQQRSLIFNQAPEAAALNGPLGSNFETHEVISEYGYASPPGAPNALHEIRKAINVDGHQITTIDKARHAMTLGLNSSEVKLKKKLLEDLEKHGLHGAATDFGQLILLFTPAHLRDFKFEVKGERQIGADRLAIVSYEQLSGSGGVTLFRGNAVTRRAIGGELMIRKRDGVPMRITMTVVSANKEITLTDESTVDYADSDFGVVLPASVVHREVLNDNLVSENTFFYTPFRKMGQKPAQLP